MNQLYRYAGLQNVKQTGLSVEQCVARLHRLAYAEERLMLLQAVQIVERPEWDLKLLLGRFQYEDSQHADGLKQRLTELRVARNKAHKAPDDPGLKLVFDEAMFAASTAELLPALTQVFKPALVRAHRNYLAETNGLADYPTVRLLKTIVAEEEEALSLLEAAYQAQVDTPEKEAEAIAWAGQLDQLLEAAGGLDGAGQV